MEAGGSKKRTVLRISALFASSREGAEVELRLTRHSSTPVNAAVHARSRCYVPNVATTVRAGYSKAVNVLNID